MRLLPPPPPPNYIPKHPPQIGWADAKSAGAANYSLTDVSFEPSEADLSAIAETRAKLFPLELSHLPEPPSHLRSKRTGRVTPSPLQRATTKQLMEVAISENLKAVSDSYIVTFTEEAFPYAFQKTDTTPAQRVHSSGATLTEHAKQVVSSVGGELYYTWDVAISGFAARLTVEQVEKLLESPEIKAVERDAVLTLSYNQTNLPVGLWGLDRIDERNDRLMGAPDENVYRYARRGEGVHVYVIDSGVRGTHVDFTGRMGAGFYVVGGSTTDTNGHGTHVAATIAGTTHGVAKAATIHPVRVTEDGYIIASDVIEAIEWIITHHNSSELAVANMSFGWAPTNPRYDDPVGFEDAIDNLIADGVVVVCAAGNSFSNLDIKPHYPAAFPQVITVGSVDKDDKRSAFSNFGSPVDIWAPGSDVLSAGIANDTATATFSGTSMAAPHVAGVAARLLQIYPGSSHVQIRDHIVSTASANKISGSLGGAANLLLFMNGWFYPFHSLGEWQNSDLPYTGQWVYMTPMNSWIWSDPVGFYPWFWIDSIQDWYLLQADTPFLTFFHYPPSGGPPSLVIYQE